MKRIVSWFIAVFAGLLPFSSEAFLCNGKDLGCLADKILPYAQSGTSKHEWAAVSGSVTGSGNTIVFKLRFDQESIDTLHYTPNWYSPQSLVFKKFGLEVDICDPSNTLRFDRIESTFPSSSKPTRDTDLSDSINKCVNSIGLLVRDAGNIDKDVDYYVYIYLKSPLPTNGVTATPSLQISADTNLLAYAQLASTFEPLIQAALLVGYQDKFDYFAVESDNYNTGWKLYQDGREGLCWYSKTSSGGCSYPTFPPPNSQSVTAAEDPGDRLTGVTTLPTASDPVTQLPDLVVKKFWLENSAGVKVKYMHPGQPLTVKGEFKNRGDGNSTATVTVKYYRSNGKKVDTNKQTVGTDTITAAQLTAGSTHSESITLNAPTTLGVYNYTACVDTTSVVTEKHESNNCSDELVIEVMTRTPDEEKKFLRKAQAILFN